MTVTDWKAPLSKEELRELRELNKTAYGRSRVRAFLKHLKEKRA